MNPPWPSAAGTTTAPPRLALVPHPRVGSKNTGTLQHADAHARESGSHRSDAWVRQPVMFQPGRKTRPRARQACSSTPGRDTAAAVSAAQTSGAVFPTPPCGPAIGPGSGPSLSGRPSGGPATPWPGPCAARPLEEVLAGRGRNGRTWPGKPGARQNTPRRPVSAQAPAAGSHAPLATVLGDHPARVKEVAAGLHLLQTSAACATTALASDSSPPGPPAAGSYRASLVQPNLPSRSGGIGLLPRTKMFQANTSSPVHCTSRLRRSCTCHISRHPGCPISKCTRLLLLCPARPGLERRRALHSPAPLWQRCNSPWGGHRPPAEDAGICAHELHWAANQWLATVSWLTDSPAMPSTA
jgi:hypothetical protein